LMHRVCMFLIVRSLLRSQSDWLIDYQLFFNWPDTQIQQNTNLLFDQQNWHCLSDYHISWGATFVVFIFPAHCFPLQILIF
jgi:hypothetical protein